MDNLCLVSNLLPAVWVWCWVLWLHGCLTNLSTSVLTCCHALLLLHLSDDEEEDEDYQAGGGSDEESEGISSDGDEDGEGGSATDSSDAELIDEEGIGAEAITGKASKSKKRKAEEGGGGGAGPSEGTAPAKKPKVGWMVGWMNCGRLAVTTCSCHILFQLVCNAFQRVGGETSWMHLHVRHVAQPGIAVSPGSCTMLDCSWYVVWSTAVYMRCAAACCKFLCYMVEQV